MIQFGAELADKLCLNSVVCFRGDLGAGKTTLAKGITSRLTGVAPEEVNSPTFTYLNIYEGLSVVYHFDLYRLGGSDEFYEMGFDEYFTKGGVCLLEWAERLEELPSNRLEIEIKHSEAGRTVEIKQVVAGEISF